MEYPIDCDTPSRRSEYCYRAQKILQDLHNKFVEWRDFGLTKAQYDRLPQKIKDKYPYLNKISMDTWKKFHDEEFMPRSIKVNQGILQYRAELKQSTRWTITISDIPKVTQWEA